MTQKERLLNYLKQHGKINPLQSWQALGIYRLSAVVLLLRKDGYKIQTVNTPVKNQFGEECHVATYILMRDDDWATKAVNIIRSATQILKEHNDKSNT